MDSHFISAMSQWAMYFLPSVVAWIRLRMGKKVPLSGILHSSESYAGLDGRCLDSVNDQCVRVQPGTVGGI
jgi:hypothetical protein